MVLNMKWNELIENKSVALIGPANYLGVVNDQERLENLEKIKSADTIVRLNCTFNFRKQYASLLEIRTDAMYNSLLNNCNNGGVLDIDEIVNARVKHIRTTPKSSISGIAESNQTNVDTETARKLKILNENNIEISVMDFNSFNRVSTAVKCRPTTGFASIFDILSFRPASLYVTGFSFFLGPPLKGYWGGKHKGGIEEVYGRTEEEEALRGFNSTRHVHKNMWQVLKDNQSQFKNLHFDTFMTKIVNMNEYSKENYEKLFK